MRPVILYWTYIGLGCLLLSNLHSVITNLQIISETDPVSFPVPFIFFTIAPLIMIVPLLFSIVGLVKKSRWARALCYVTVSMEVLRMLGFVIYFALFVEPDDSVTALAPIVFMMSVTLFLFLAYKIYSSKPLKTYLGTYNT
jgi:hypothetical protein